MGTVVKGLFKNKWQPQLQFVRFRNKINISKPRPPHYERALLETVCVPYFNIKKKPQHIPDYESCNSLDKKKIVKVEEEHPLKVILAKEDLNHFEKSKLVAFFHINSLSAEEKFQSQLLFKRNGMKLKFYSKIILDLAFKDTIYEPLLQLYRGPTATAFCPEPDMHSLLKMVKKAPKLILMAALVENHLLSLTELQQYGKFKNIMEARTALVSVLNSASQNLAQQINHHPSNFLELLNQYKKLLEDNSSKS